MDFLPIPPSSTNKVNASINLANDGGSKSNTGYFNKRNQDKEALKGGDVDEVNLSSSNSSKTPEEGMENEFSTFFDSIREFFAKIKNFILKIFGLNKPKVENIFKED